MNASAVPTLEKNHFHKYEQLLSCVLTLKPPNGSKSKSLVINSTLINKFTSTVCINVNNKNKLPLSNSQDKQKSRATATKKQLQMNICIFYCCY